MTNDRDTKKVKLTLKVEVTYDLNDTPVLSLLNVLHGIADCIAQDGSLTGQTGAEVDSWTHSVQLGEL